MNGIGTSQLDIFLNFSEVHLLVFSSKWNLVDLRPHHRYFIGWDETTIEAFKFEKNFLRPNHLTLQQFLGDFQQKDYVIKNYYWRDVNGQVLGPYETYFRLKKENGQIRSLMAFVKDDGLSEKVSISPHDKYLMFLSKLLPGLIHNINGPLGTLTGRIELLNFKYQNIKELDEMLKMGFRIQNLLENLSFKLINERYFQPVEINLNRLLREEIKFLSSDLFFKHQVQKNERFEPNIPQFRLYYLSISGVLSECYYFLKKFVYEDQEYVFYINSFFEKGNAGFMVKFLGDFHHADDIDMHFPFSLEGDARKMARENFKGLDTAFLTYCLRLNHGTIQLSGRKELFALRLEFPLPVESD